MKFGAAIDNSWGLGGLRRDDTRRAGRCGALDSGRDGRGDPPVFFDTVGDAILNATAAFEGRILSPCQCVPLQTGCDGFKVTHVAVKLIQGDGILVSNVGTLLASRADVPVCAVLDGIIWSPRWRIDSELSRGQAYKAKNGQR